MTEVVHLGAVFEEREAPLSRIAVRGLALDFISQWRRVGMAADYLASHLSYAFSRRDVAHNVLSTVVNELLENAVKFSADGAHPVGLELLHFGERLVLRADNVADRAGAERFQALLAAILEEDPEQLFVAHLERTAQAPEGTHGIGLVVLRKDYGARLGVSLRPLANDLVEVVVKATLDPDSVEAE